jgi:hypothetical protein
LFEQQTVRDFDIFEVSETIGVKSSVEDSHSPAIVDGPYHHRATRFNIVKIINFWVHILAYWTTVANWEKKRTSPNILQCGSVIRFLGCDPFPTPTTFAERLVSFRRKGGLRVLDAARMAGVDPFSWASWENERHRITTACEEKVLRLLETPSG